MSHIEVIGVFEKSIVVINGKEVPNISVYNNTSKNVTFVLDINSHSIDIPIELAEAFILFVAHSMAQGAGYSCFGTENRFNKFNRNIIALNAIDMNDLSEQEKQGE